MDAILPYVADFLLCIAVVLLLYRQKKLVKRQEAKLQQLANEINEAHADKTQQLEHQIEIISKGSLGVGRRLMNAEKRLNHTMERQHEMENQDTENLSFNQAATLLERGIGLNDVVSKVGITRSEAKLVKLFQFSVNQ